MCLKCNKKKLSVVILMENKTCNLLDIYNVDENVIVKENFQ